jgi:FkbM family methyltransferase
MKSKLKNVAEKLSRGRVFRRRLPANVGGGPFYVTPEAGLRYYRDISRCDPELLGADGEHICKGDVVWDIGANVGLFTFAAANLTGLGGSVLAIEAGIWLGGLLRRSARLSWPGRAPVEVLAVAVSNNCGISHFEIAERARASNHLQGHGSNQAGGWRETQSVMSMTLDWLLQQRRAPQISKGLE